MGKRVFIEVKDDQGKWKSVATQEGSVSSHKTTEETYDIGIGQYERTLMENRLEDIKEELQMARKLREEHTSEVLQKLAQESIDELNKERRVLKKVLKEGGVIAFDRVFKG